MKGLIIIPSKCYNMQICYRTYLLLFNMIKDELGWSIEVSDDINPSKINADIVMVFETPEKNNLGLHGKLYELSNDIKLICFNMDLHHKYEFYDFQEISYINDFISAFNKLFNRADRIMCPYKKPFIMRWPQYIDKFEHFPQFINEMDYLDIKFNDNPIHKCLLTGNTLNIVYPLRMFISKQENVIQLPHPGYTSKLPQDSKIGREYIIELNKYLCGATDCSKIEYVVLKYFEIPATGSLLLAQFTDDLNDLGFTDGVNYVSITQDNFVDILKDILCNSSNYHNIRKNGRDFIFKNHTSRNRIEQFNNMIKQMTGDI